MSFNHFKVDDFIENESFQSFALNRHQDDITFWAQWIKNHPEKKAEFDEALSVLRSFEFRNEPVESKVFANGLEKLEQSLNGDVAQPVTLPMRPTKNYLKIAAAIALLIGVTAASFVYVKYFYDKSNQIFVEKSTPRGTKLSVKLPDGSLIKLNGGSRLTYRQNDITKTRKLTLEGEAFFEVKRDTLRPFIVTSGNVTTTALGTSFNIRSYPSDPFTKIYLVTGKIKVDQSDGSLPKPFTLLPGDGISYDEVNKTLTVSKGNSEDAIAWKNGVIKFNNASITDVKNILERWYGVDIILNNMPSDDWRIDGTFENESLENVLRSLQYTSKMEYNFKKDILIITFN